MKQQELSVLSNVIAVARRELADREDKEIPPRLRRVAKRGGRRLPPPFEASIVKELRTDDAFRESVLERWRRFKRRHILTGANAWSTVLEWYDARQHRKTNAVTPDG